MQNQIIKSKLLKKSLFLSLLSIVTFTSSPVLADVKDGVDAWSRGEYDVAVREWRPEALNGNADAQFNLGQAYKLGRGVEANLNTALDWYKRAADQGHLQAGDSYGHLLHYQGRVSDAIPYLERSSARGEPRSQYLFATELFNGNHVSKDWVRAYALMTRSSSSGLGPASRSLAQMDRFIPLSQRQQGIALAGNLEQSERNIKAQQLAGFDLDTSPASPVARPVTLPPSQIAAPTQATSAPGAPFLDNPAPPVAATPVRPAVVPASRPTTNGDYRIQLGAFAEQNTAKSLWNNLERRVDDLQSIQPYLVTMSNVTRLQAGPFATRSQANIMCAKIKAAGQGCFSLKK